MFRRPKSSYTVVSNELANSDLSLACVGMLVYLLSKPDGWEGHNHNIERRGGFGSRVRRNLTKEAERAGWLKFCTEHRNGRLNCYYEVQAEPLPEDQRTDSSKHGQNCPENTTPSKWEGCYNPPTDKGVVDNEVVGEGVIDNKDLPIKDLKIKEVEEEETAAASDWIDLAKQLGLTPSQADLLSRGRKRVPKSLLTAALACWLDPRGAKRRWSDNSPIGFVRGVISDPEAFGVIKTAAGFSYGMKTEPFDPNKAGLVRFAVRKIQEMRREGRSDRSIFIELSLPFKPEILREAFKEAGNA